MRADQEVSRRDFLKKATLLGGVVPLVLSACGGETQPTTPETETPTETPMADESGFACTDTTGLTDVEIAQRNSSAYVDISTMPDKDCLNCNFWQSGTEATACGLCLVVKGPIHPKGYCNLWAAKVV